MHDTCVSMDHMSLHTPFSSQYATRKPKLDRFIPLRSSLNMESAHNQVTNGLARPLATFIPTTPTGYGLIDRQTSKRNLAAYRKRLSFYLNSVPTRVLPFSPCTSPSSPTLSKSSYNSSPLDTSRCEPLSSPQSPRRRLYPHSPDKVRTLPGMRDDFYTSAMDWGRSNILALALGDSTSLWQVDDEKLQVLREDNICDAAAIPAGSGGDGIRASASAGTVGGATGGAHVSSVKWSRDNDLFVEGWSNGTIKFWEPNHAPLACTNVQMTSTRIGCLEWVDRLLYCGSHDGRVSVLDTRQLCCTHIFTAKRKPEVMSVRLSPDKRYLATGSDDGYVRIWCLRTRALLHEIDSHLSSIKALAWCPWRRDLLASGGGVNDGRLRLWDSNRGSLVSEVETNMQTCAVVWSEEFRELVSSHGYPSNDLVVWSVQDVTCPQPMASLTYHKRRPLQLALSPDGATLASAGADERLCLWSLFPKSRTGRHSQRSPLDMLWALR